MSSRADQEADFNGSHEGGDMTKSEAADYVNKLEQVNDEMKAELEGLVNIM